jgi:hypothetical protein
MQGRRGAPNCDRRKRTDLPLLTRQSFHFDTRRTPSCQAQAIYCVQIPNATRPVPPRATTRNAPMAVMTQKQQLPDNGPCPATKRISSLYSGNSYYVSRLLWSAFRSMGQAVALFARTDLTAFFRPGRTYRQPILVRDEIGQSCFWLQALFG